MTETIMIKQKIMTWISVKDRLPEKEDYYTVKFKNGVVDEKPFRNDTERKSKAII